VSVRLLVNVPVWGDRYVDRWLRWSLPSLMADGNLPALARRAEVTVQVVTRPQDAARLGTTELVDELCRLVRTEIVEIDGLRSGYGGMSRGNLVSLRAAATEQAAFCFGWADVIWPDGAFGVVADLTLSHRAVLGWGCVLAETGVAAELDAARKDSRLVVTGRQMARLVLDHPHATLRGSEVGDSFVPSGPTNALWVAPDRKSALVRAHTWQLLGINFSRVPPKDASRYLRLLAAGRANDSVDAYPPIVDDLSDVAFIDDTDAALPASVDDDRPITSQVISCDPQQQPAMLRNTIRKHRQHPWVVPLSRYLFTRTYRIHTNNDTEWINNIAQQTQHLAAITAILDYQRRLIDVVIQPLIKTLTKTPRPIRRLIGLTLKLAMTPTVRVGTWVVSALPFLHRPARLLGAVLNRLATAIVGVSR